MDSALENMRAKEQRSLSGYRENLEKKRDIARVVNIKLSNAAQKMQRDRIIDEDDKYQRFKFKALVDLQKIKAHKQDKKYEKEVIKHKNIEKIELFNARNLNSDISILSRPMPSRKNKK
jgi:hypothetical protein